STSARSIKSPSGASTAMRGSSSIPPPVICSYTRIRMRRATSFNTKGHEYPRDSVEYPFRKNEGTRRKGNELLAGSFLRKDMRRADYHPGAILEMINIIFGAMLLLRVPFLPFLRDPSC